MDKKIAIGTETHLPTWTWMGFDLARELSKYYEVKPFRWDEKVPEADMSLIIKTPIKADNSIYFPCDAFDDEQFMGFVKGYKAVVCQSQSLADTVKKHNPNTFVVEHNLRYALPKMNAYKKDGFILYVGFACHLPHLRTWLEKNPLSRELIVLTDQPYQYQLGVRQFHWTPRLQMEMMELCSAAIDIKGEDFNQLNRSGHKLEAFMASGIPCYCNHDLVDGFKFSLDNWFLEYYYDATCFVGRKLREERSLEKIGLKVKAIIDANL
jgi:hypothetical protein